ncbi:MAG: SIS domain-containing protein [Nocardioidaceae bacterium]
MFDDALLEDPAALRSADPALRHLAESGARVRKEVGASAEEVASLDDTGRPRAVVVAGRDARLVRAVLESSCPVPFVVWAGPGLPGWAGALDLVVVLAQTDADESALSTVAEAVRRGCGLVVACPAGSAAAELGGGRYSATLTTTTDDPLAGTVVLLAAMRQMGLAPHTDGEEVASVLDDVAVDCSPFRDVGNNPAKDLALAIGDGTPLLWGGSVLAGRAARRVAEAMRRTTGRIALAGETEHLLPVIEATPPRDVFADPFEDGGQLDRRCLVVLDDGTDDTVISDARTSLTDASERRDLRVEAVTAGHGSEVSRYASLLSTGGYTAVYLGVALARDGRG